MQQQAQLCLSLRLRLHLRLHMRVLVSPLGLSRVSCVVQLMLEVSLHALSCIVTRMIPRPLNTTQLLCSGCQLTGCRRVFVK